jgi:hypothetical protein
VPNVTPAAAGAPTVILPPPVVFGAGDHLLLGRDTSPPDTSLHVLHCVWLC